MSSQDDAAWMQDWDVGLENEGELVGGGCEAKARHSMPHSRLHPALLQRALQSLQSHLDKL